MVPRNRKPEQLSFAERFTLEREKIGSQSDVARQTGLGQVSISNIEGGRTKAEKIRAETLFVLADLFQVRARWLLRGTPPRKAADVSPLKPDEARLLAAFRELPKGARMAQVLEMEAAAVRAETAPASQGATAKTVKTARPKILTS